MFRIEKRIASGKSICRKCEKRTLKGKNTIHLTIDNFCGFLCIDCADKIQNEININLMSKKDAEETLEKRKRTRFEKILDE